MAKHCTLDSKLLFLDEAYYRIEKNLGIDPYREDPVEVVVSPFPMHLGLDGLIDLFEISGNVRLAYIVKDSQGRDACVDNSPSEGGTKGLRLLANVGLEKIRGSGQTQDLGTAFITMHGDHDAIGAVISMSERMLVKDGSEWRILVKEVANRPFFKNSLQVSINAFMAEDFFVRGESPMEFPKPSAKDVWVRGQSEGKQLYSVDLM